MPVAAQLVTALPSTAAAGWLTAPAELADAGSQRAALSVGVRSGRAVDTVPGLPRFSVCVPGGEVSVTGAPDASATVHSSWVLTSSTCLPDNTTPGKPAHPVTVTVGRPDLTTTTGHVVQANAVIPRTDRSRHHPRREHHLRADQLQG